MYIGIICEFDPLHSGHARLLSHARAMGADAVICAMSGNFVQRGEFAVVNKLSRAEMALRGGADLVLGHHSHRLNPIEQYKGVYICYSLGNFCFAGNNKPDDMTSFMFQTRFRVRDGEVSNEGFRIIPIRISSTKSYNDFAPTPLTDDTAIDTVMTTLKSNGKKLEYAVETYPLSW